MRSSVRYPVPQSGGWSASSGRCPYPPSPVGCGPSGRQRIPDRRGATDHERAKETRWSGPKHRTGRRRGLLGPIVALALLAGQAGILTAEAAPPVDSPGPPSADGVRPRHRRHPVLERRLRPARLRSRDLDREQRSGVQRRHDGHGHRLQQPDGVRGLVLDPSGPRRLRQGRIRAAATCSAIPRAIPATTTSTRRRRRMAAITR